MKIRKASAHRSGAHHPVPKFELLTAAYDLMTMSSSGAETHRKKLQPMQSPRGAGETIITNALITCVLSQYWTSPCAEIFYVANRLWSAVLGVTLEYSGLVQIWKDKLHRGNLILIRVGARAMLESTSLVG